jgi:cytochrome c oxidase assembly factor CtaG/putative copper export protein
VSKPTPLFRRASVAFGLLAAVMVAAVVIGMILGGAATPTKLADAGDFVRWGLPIAKGATYLGMAVAIGSLAFAAYALSAKTGQLTRAMNLAALGAGAWAIFGAISLLFTYLSVTGSAFSTSELFGQSLWLFVTTIELGRYLALNLMAGAILTVLALGFQNLTSALLLAALGLLGLVPIALTGHAAGAANHAMAVNSIGLHLVAVTIWVGGLVALVVVRDEDPVRQANLVKRYSTLALIAFMLVAVSGIAVATISLGKFENLFTPYGLLVALKVAALLLLGAIGGHYRYRLIGKLATTSAKAKEFWFIVCGELLVMGAAVGLGTALSRTAPPEDPLANFVPTPASILTGEPLPTELLPITWFTAWKLDLLWLVVALGAIAIYLFGVWRLKRRGDKWPLVRTISWVTGWLFLIYITSGALNVYEQYLFSVHMISHMMLTMGVPLFLVPGAPITLLVRAAAKRKDDSKGIREWALWAVHTKWAQLVSNPIFAGVNFAASLVIFYFTPIFSWATHEHVGHEWMIIHFVITGYLFIQALVGIDPGPQQLPYTIRLMLLIGTLTFHAFFGLSLMTGSGLLLADWYGAMGRTWGVDPISDQQNGGAIAWGIGELPSAALTLIVCVQWFKSGTREARRLDRASDRSGNKDIEDYNAYLERLAKLEERR